MLQIQCVRKQLYGAANFVAKEYCVSAVGCSHCNIVLQDFLCDAMIVVRSTPLAVQGVVESRQHVNVLDQGIKD